MGCSDMEAMERAGTNGDVPADGLREGVVVVGLVPEDVNSRLHRIGAALHFLGGGLGMMAVGFSLRRWFGWISAAAGVAVVAATVALGEGEERGPRMWEPVRWNVSQPMGLRVGWSLSELTSTRGLAPGLAGMPLTHRPSPSADAVRLMVCPDLQVSRQRGVRSSGFDLLLANADERRSCSGSPRVVGSVDLSLEFHPDGKRPNRRSNPSHPLRIVPGLPAIRLRLRVPRSTALKLHLLRTLLSPYKF